MVRNKQETEIYVYWRWSRKGLGMLWRMVYLGGKRKESDFDMLWFNGDVDSVVRKYDKLFALEESEKMIIIVDSYIFSLWLPINFFFTLSNQS